MMCSTGVEVSEVAWWQWGIHGRQRVERGQHEGTAGHAAPSIEWKVLPGIVQCLFLYREVL